MLAKETATPFSSPDWIFEIKWDGYRAIAELNGSDVRLYSRNGNSFATHYPHITDALASLNLQAVVDGEIIVPDADGRPNFGKLQHYAEHPEYPLQYHLFDLLELNGQPLYHLPLLERKAKLQQLLPANDMVHYSDHVVENGEAFFEVAGHKNLEGIIAKKANSEYQPGKRSSEWLKIKHHKTEEAVIVGFTAPRGSRKLFGALVLGMYQQGTLHYIGHTGSGFSDDTLRDVYGKLKPLVTDEAPFAEKVKTNQPVTWVKPQYVCEVKFTEWTRDGSLRHPIFLGLRPDKEPADVVDNTIAPKAENKTTPAMKKAAAKKATKKAPAKRTATHASANNQKVYTFGRTKVATTNRTKIFFPGEGLTKGDVIDYYDRIADYILPYLKNRPQSLYRTPNGIGKKGFFHKDAGDAAPAFVKSVPIHSESTGKDIEYIICNNKATLLYVANLGSIEINPWHSTIQHPDAPDYLMIDIDPSDQNTFDDVVEAALATKDVLSEAGADSYCKTSGATGLHVYVPLRHKYTYEQVKDFAWLVCIMVNERLPGITTLERSLKKRSKKHIYMDYLQNRRGQTIASVYSLRPKPGATVSAPLDWKEVKKGLRPDAFTIHTIFDRLKEKGDLFEGVLGKGVDLAKCLDRLSALHQAQQ